MASHAARLSVAISSMAAPMALRVSTSCLAAVETIPTPSGLVSTSTSPGLAAGVGDDARGMDRPRHGHAVDGLVGLDGVTADDVDAGLLRLVGAAAQDVAEHRGLERPVGEAHEVERRNGLPPIA